MESKDWREPYTYMQKNSNYKGNNNVQKGKRVCFSNGTLKHKAASSASSAFPLNGIHEIECSLEAVYGAVSFVTGDQRTREKDGGMTSKPETFPLISYLPWWKHAECMKRKWETDFRPYLLSGIQCRQDFTGSESEYQKYLDMCMMESKYLVSWRAKVCVHNNHFAILYSQCVDMVIYFLLGRMLRSLLYFTEG